MALTQISTGGVKNDAVTAGKIPANAVGSSEIADDAVDQGAIADEAVDEARLQISNAGTNGQFLSKQSGNTGGLTWADANSYTHPNHSGEVTSTGDGATVIASNIVDEDNLKISNAGTNGQYLQKQSGNTGGLTWADVTIPPSGNTFTAVANGAIANNKPVKLDTDGKVSEIKETLTDLSAPATISSNLDLPIQGGGLGSKFNRLARISDTQLCAIWWDSSDRIRTRLIKISNNGNTYSCHSPLTDGGQMQELADNGYIRDLDIAYDPNRNKLLAIWVENHTIKGRVGTVNGTDVSSTITWATTTTIESGSSAGPARRVHLVWNEDLQNFGLFFITQGSDDKTYGKVVTINSSGAIEVNTTIQIMPYSGEDYPINDPSTLAACYDTTNNRYAVFLAGRNGTSRFRSGGACLSASGTGTSASLTVTSGHQSDVNLMQNESVSSYPNGRHKLFQACYDPSKDLVLLSYVDVDTIGNGYNHLYVRLYKNHNNNNDFTFGNAITMVQATTSTWHLQYSAGINKPVLTYVDTNGDLIAKILTISGTAKTSSISFSSATNINSSQDWESKLNEGDGGEVGQWSRGTTTASGGRIIFAAAGASRIANIIPYKVQNITPNFTVADTYVGFADAAYTNGQTVTVKTYGNNVSTLSGLTIGSKYYVQTNGTVGTSAGSPSAIAGIAIAADKLLIKEPT